MFIVWITNICLFVCFCGVYRPTREFFIHHCRWRATNFDVCSVSWSLSSEGSLTCHTYCDAGLPFIMIISEDPWRSHKFAERLAVLTTQVCRDRGSNPDLPHARRTSTPPRRQRKKLNNRIWYWSCTRKVMPINVIKKKQVTTGNCLQYGTIIINF